MQTQDLQGSRWEVNNFSNTVWEAAIWMHHFFQVRFKNEQHVLWVFGAAASWRWLTDTPSGTAERQKIAHGVFIVRRVSACKFTVLFDTGERNLREFRDESCCR